MTNGQSFDFVGDVSANTLVTTSNSYDLAFNADLAVVTDTNFAAIGDLSFGSNSASLTSFAGGLDTTAVTGSVTLHGAIRTAGQQADFGAFTLGADAAIDTTNNGSNVGGANINITTMTGAGSTIEPAMIKPVAGR